jgi:hypothetical protein
MGKVISFSNKAFMLILICFEALFVSCQDKITKIKLINKNPVEYTFNTSKDSLFKTMTVKLTFLRIMSIMSIKDKSNVPSEISELFSQGINKQDIFLLSDGGYWKSRIYQKKDGEFLDYRVSFYLHLEKIDENHTKVIIKTIEPKVIVGMEFFPSPPHFVRNNKTIAVEPSTIEEYEILLEIGKIVGEKDMPTLILPDERSHEILMDVK